MSERVGAADGKAAFWPDADDSDALSRLRGLVNAVDAGIVQFDDDGRIAGLNERVVELTGFGREALVGQPASRLLADEDADRVERVCRREFSADGTESGPFPVAVRTTDGGTVAGELRLQPFDVDGSADGIVGIIRHAPERTGAEAADGSRRPTDGPEAADGSRRPTDETAQTSERDVRRTERRFEAVFEDPNILVRLLDPDGTVLDVNRTAMEYVDADLADVTGEPFWETPWWGQGDGVREDVKEWTERAAAGEYVDFEADLTRPDGRRYALEGVFRPVTNDEGEVVSIIVSDRDVTERTRRERELERYEAIVETVDDGVYVVDGDGRFTMVNDAYAAMVGYDREELLGEHVSLVVGDDVVARAQRLESAMRDGEKEATTAEAELLTADGDRLPAEAAFALLPTADGTTRRVGVVRDVSERRQRERELEESERRYRTLVEHFPNGAVALVDEDLTYRTVGGEPTAVAGVTAADVEGKPVSEAIPPALAHELVPRYEAAFDGEKHSFEAASNGRIYEFTIVPIRDDGGDVFAALGMSQDVTERTEAERKLAESERRYRTLVEHFPNGAVALFDEDLRYQIAGGKAFDQLDDATETVENATIRERYPPKLADRLEAEFEAALAGETNTFELALHGRDWLAHTVPVTDDDGQIFAGMIMVQEITERKEHERELELALDLLDKTERIADVGGWEIDPDTMEVFWTDHIFDLLAVPTDEEPPLEAALDMYHEDDQPVIEGAIEDALDDGERFDVEARIRTHDGEVRWLRVQGVPEVVDGDIASLRGAAQDVTERKERERQLEEVIEKLEESNERLERFAYAASHDLQEPLRMISSYLQLIERRYVDELDDDAAEFIAYAVDGADRMKAMIEGLLEYSRVETQGDPLEPVDLDEVVAAARRDLQVKIAETDAVIETGSLPPVRGDPSQLRQVLQNLLENALEYAGEDPPRIDVSAEREGEAVAVSVRDEGIGIDPDDQERIFEVFQRLHGRDEYDGTGIGLALCERIVERHGGEIRVDSEPGEGTTFTFTVPAADE